MGYTRLGPGLATIGIAPDDITCQVLGARVVPTVETADTVRTLCADGDIIGDTTTTYTWDATILQDPVTGGISEFAWTNHDTDQPLVFTPNSADEASFSGTVRVYRMEYGADARGDLIQADVSWPFTDEPVPTWQAAAP